MLFAPSFQKLLTALETFRKSRHDDSVRVAEGLENLKHSIDTHREAYEKRSQADPPITITTLRTDVPIAVQTQTKRSKIEVIWVAIKGPLEVLGIFAVVAYTVVSYNIWQEQADATNAASRQAELSRKGLNETLKNFAVDERAWIYISGLNLETPQVGQPITAQIWIKNSGKSPAKLTKGPISLWPSETPLNRVHDVPAERHNPLSMLFPEITYGPDLISTPHGANKAQVDAYGQKRLWVYVYGRIGYLDIFGKHHTTSWCGVANGTNTFGACPEGTYPVFAD